jgi:ABC-2 type transport system ATP-binding protein
LPEEQIRQATDKWLDRLHMEAWRKHRVGTFSTGMKQRINVARALLHHPDVLFLDEPTLGLDPQTTHAIHEFVQELKEEGMTVVLTTHDMVEAETLCQQIAIIDQARIVACDTTINLKRLLSADNTTVIDVEIANLSEAMLSQLRTMESVASVARPDTYRVRIHTRNADNLAPILNMLSSLGANVRTINTVLPTMEDVFLHVTGREMRDKAAASVPSVRARRWGGASRVR